MPTEIPSVKVIPVAGSAFTYEIAKMPGYNVQVDVTYKKTPFDDPSITIGAIADKVYKGSAWELTTAELVVKDGDVTLIKGTDYTVSYENNVNVGTAKVTITAAEGSGFTGSKETSFKITPKSVNAEDITIDAIADQPYTGSQIKPAPVVKDGTRNVTLGSADYDTSWGDNINVATGGTVTIKGKGNYKDERTVTFKITKVDPTVNQAPTGKTGLVYNANPQDLVNGGTATGGKIEYSTDGGNTWSETIPTKTDANENGYPVQWRVTGDDNHSTTTPQEIKVPIEKATLTELQLDPESFTYDGKQKKPAETVKAGTLTVPTSDYTIEGNTGTDAKEYTATVTGKGNFKGTAQKKWTIGAADITSEDDFTASLDPTTFVYDGKAKTPTVTVTRKSDNVKLTVSTDYSVAYSNNINVGNNTAKATVTGKGNYKGTRELTFSITKLALTSVTVDPASLPYNGKEQTIAIKEVKAGDITLTTADYEVQSGNKATNVGEYTLIVKAKDGSNFSGTASTKWSITKLSIANAVVTLNPTEYTYDGTKKEPTATVKVGDLTLTAGTDFNVTYQNNINAGTATAKITGNGNYKDETSKNFTINQAELTSVELETASLTFNGAEQTVKVKEVKAGNLTVPTTDYTIVSGTDKGTNVKEYEIQVTGKNNFKGTAKTKWNIKQTVPGVTKAPTAKTGLTYNAQDQVLVENGTVTGGEIVFSTDGTNWSKDLPKGKDAKDYPIQWKVKGDDNHSDSEPQDITGKINPATIDKVLLNANKLTYNGGEQTVTIYQVKSGSLIVPASDYDLVKDSDKGTNVGKYAISVSGKNNFTGTASADWWINAASLEDAKVTLNPTEYTYDGTAKTPEAKVEKFGKVLQLNTDYTVSYKNNVNAGTATATITGKGNYEKTIDAQFVIKKAELDAVTLKNSKLTYILNTEQTVEIASVTTKNGLTVTADNYTVSGNKGTDAKSYTLTVTAKENTNYTGSATAEWEIQKKSAKDFTVELDQKEFQYDGTAKEPGVTVKDGENVLTLGTHYTLEFKDNVQAGINTAKVIVTGIGNYTDKKEDVTFSILRAAGNIKADPEQVTMTYGIDPQTYTITIIEPTDLENYYFVSGDENIAIVDSKTGVVTAQNAGVTTIYVVVMGDNNYESMFAVSQVIVKPVQITDADVEESAAGSNGIPTYTAKKFGKTLVEGVDYTLEFYDKDEVKKTAAYVVSNPGDYMAVLTFAGNYYGIVEKKFKANGIAISVADFSELLLNADNPNEPVNAENAKYDFNGDNFINIADLQALLNMQLGLTPEGDPISSGSRASVNAVEDAVLNVSTSDLGGGVTRYALSLDGDREFSAFMMDVVTTGNAMVTNEQAASSEMTLSTGTLRNGSLRLMGIGAEQSGSVVFIDVMGEGSVSFENVCFSTQQATAFFVRQAGNATGIGLTNAAAAEGDVFGLGGQRQVTLQKGVNIVRSQNGKAVKVLKK